MIFSDERTLWADEQNELAILLANKSQDEVGEILEGYSKLLIKSSGRKERRLQRLVQLCTAPLLPILFLLMPIKWLLTGDKYLDSWLCKIGMTAERTKKYFL